MMLVAMLTFQAALNPPGNLHQQQPINDTAASSTEGSNHTVDHLIQYSSHIFLFFNSLRFFISLHVFHVVTKAFPFRLELLFSVFALGITYISCLIIKLPTYFCYYLCVGMPLSLVFALSLSRRRKFAPKENYNSPSFTG